MATARAVLDAVRAAEASGASPSDVLDAALGAAARFPVAATTDPATTDPATTAYRAKDGDVLDAVATQVYGDEYAAVDLLAANPALAASAHLEAGTLVRLPPVQPHPRERPIVQIWD